MAAVRDLTGGAGVNVVLDIVAGAYVPRNLDVLALEGRLLQIGVLGGPKTEINVGVIMQKRLTVTGSTLRARPMADKAAIASAVHENVWPLLESGAVKPIVHATFPMRDAAAAHRLMESSEHVGKIVLVRENLVIG